MNLLGLDVARVQRVHRLLIRIYAGLDGELQMTGACSRILVGAVGNHGCDVRDGRMGRIANEHLVRGGRGAGTNRGILRYGGLLRCKDCGRTFIGKRIKLKSGERVAYVCDTYHRYGKEHCSSHMVDEEALDRLIGAEIQRTKKMYEENWSRMERLIEKWTPKASVASSKITKLKEHILLLEEEVEVILMERIRDKAHAERYDRMIAKREEQITEARKQIEELQNVSEVLRSRQAKLKRDISLIDDILQEGKMSEAHLRMLVEKILVHEEDGKLDLEIRLKAPFRDHLDIFENGAQTDCFPSADFEYDRLGAVIYGDYYAG